MDKISVEIQQFGIQEVGNFDPINEVRQLDFDGEYIVVSKDVANIIGLKEKDKKVISSIKGVKYSDDVSLGIKQNGFWIDHKAFRKCKQLYKDGFLIIDNLLVDYTGKDTEIIIPDGVEIVNDKCFEARVDFKKEPIEKISFPSSLKMIGDKALYCSEYFATTEEKVAVGFIKEVEFRGGCKNLEYVGDMSIPECSSISGFDSFDSLQFLGLNFWRCDSSFYDSSDGFLTFGPFLLRYENYSDRVTDNRIEKITIPDNVEYIAGGINSGVFANMSALKEVEFPKSLKSIGSYTFRNDKALAKISLPDSLKYIGERAFADCIALKEVTIPESVEYIGKNAFKMNNTNGPNINVPERLAVSYGGVEQCKSYIGIPDPDGLLVQGDILRDAYNVKSSRSFAIPEGIKAIHGDVMKRLLSAQCFVDEIVFPSTVEYIDPLDIYTNNDFSVYLPEMYLAQKKKLSTDVIKNYLKKCDTESLKLDTFVLLFLYQQKKAIDDYCVPRMLRESENAMHLICDYLSESDDQKMFLHAAQFIVDNKKAIPAQRVMEFYELCEASGMKKPIDLLKPIVDSLGEIEPYTESESAPAEATNTIYGRVFVTTGLSNSDEKYVKENVEPRGGVFKPHFVNTCNYLICYSQEGPGTTKYEKAMEQIKKGRDLKIVTFEEFKDIVMNAGNEPLPIEVKQPTSNPVEKYVFPDDKDQIVEDAIKLFCKCYKKLNEKLDGYEATVIEMPGMGRFPGKIMKEKFYNKLIEFLSNTEGHYYNDSRYTPEQLRKSWLHDHGPGLGQVGLTLTLGYIIAELALCENDVSGDLVYCRDKWEYRGDYSSRTRPALHIEPNINEWKVFSKKGYPYYEM